MNRKNNGKFFQTTCRKLSNSVKKTLLGKTIPTRTRNPFLDDFMLEIVTVRLDMNIMS